MLLTMMTLYKILCEASLLSFKEPREFSYAIDVPIARNDIEKYDLVHMYLKMSITVSAPILFQ
jgi:hypothetical protein